jgi:hypothetical protein
MNWLAFFDGLLAATALWIAVSKRGTRPALALASMLLGMAALLGSLRFSGLLALPEWHQFFSMLGASAALPLLALSVVAPASVITLQRRYAWIFAVAASVASILIVLVVQFKVWASLLAVVSALAILTAGVARKQMQIAAGGLALLIGLILFATKFHWGALQPGDFLHMGLILSLLAIGQAPAPQRR